MKNLTLFLALCLGPFLIAQDFDQAKLDTLFKRIENNNKGMGSLSIYKDGQEVYQKSYGYADVENKIKPNTQTQYRIGSISKTFTATLVMKLVEENKLDLNTKLSKFYPSIKNAKKITIGMMMAHRSGIYSFTNEPDYLEYCTKPFTKQELVDKIAAYSSDFIPNSKAEYSNSNYLLLTFIIEDVTGKSYTNYLKEIIIDPCKLERTAFGDKIEVSKNEALSYFKQENWTLEIETDMSVPLGAGSIVSTPSNLNLFFNCLFNGKIISNESLNQMKKMQDDYGMGLFKIPFYNKTAFGHSGRIDGFNSNVAYFPTEKVSVAITCNAVDYPLNEILIGALSIYFGKEYELPEFKPALVLNAEDLKDYLGVYSHPDLPLKITISQDGNVLMAQGTNQPSFALECYEKNKFKFDAAMLKIEFNPTKNTLLLKQGGGEYLMTKE